jgi:hypothetical protein
MSKGLGKLQITVLNIIERTKLPFVATVGNVYRAAISEYYNEDMGFQYKFYESWGWGYRDEELPRLKKYRASISQAIRSLQKRELIGKFEGVFFITPKGKEVVSINRINT